MSALDITGRDLVRALTAVRTAVHGRADKLAAELTGEGLAADVRDLPNGDCEVVVTGPGLFAREFGSQAAPADPVVTRIIDREARR